MRFLVLLLQRTHVLVQNVTSWRLDEWLQRLVVSFMSLRSRGIMSEGKSLAMETKCKEGWRLLGRVEEFWRWRLCENHDGASVAITAWFAGRGRRMFVRASGSTLAPAGWEGDCRKLQWMRLLLARWKGSCLRQRPPVHFWSCFRPRSQPGRCIQGMRQAPRRELLLRVSKNPFAKDFINCSILTSILMSSSANFKFWWNVLKGKRGQMWRLRPLAYGGWPCVITVLPRLEVRRWSFCIQERLLNSSVKCWFKLALDVPPLRR